MLLQIAIFHSFLWPSNIPLCVCVCVCVCHIVIHSFVQGHLGSVLVLVVVNNAVMNIEVHVSLNQHFIFSEYPRKVGFLDHMETLFLVFRGTCILFSIVFSTTIPTSSVGGFVENLEL